MMEILMGIRAVQRWKYWGKEEKEGSVAASKDVDKGQKVRRRRADEDPIARSTVAMGMIFG